MVDVFSDLRRDSTDVAEFMSIFASPRRLEILAILLVEEVSVNNLSARLGISQSALSQHLALLRAHNAVDVRRDSQLVFYRCDKPEIRKLMLLLARIWPNVKGAQDAIFGMTTDADVRSSDR
jgi:ArsR family transcriptional regulator, virulence genes transcriptional regulator